MITQTPKQTAMLIVLVNALLLSCNRGDEPHTKGQPGPAQNAHSVVQPTDQATGILWGVAPYWNDPPSDPIHAPRAVYLDIYWRDLKPTPTSVLTPQTVLAAIERRLGRALMVGPPVAIRFKATGDAENGPLPDWFPASWRAPGRCETEDKQQLPSWTDNEQVRAHADLVKALASGLDGHPQVAWMEPGSYGFWGEGHLDGAPLECQSPIETREALIRPWVESFRKTPLSVTMDWIRDKDDPEHRLRNIWNTAAHIGLRFDCLGFWHDEYAAVVERMADAGMSGWKGPWGGEFCFGENGSRWSMGSDSVSDLEVLRSNAPSAVRQMTGEARRNRTLKVVRDCGWSYLAGAGGSLVTKPGEAALALENVMNEGQRDLKKCALAAAAANQ